MSPSPPGDKIAQRLAGVAVAEIMPTRCLAAGRRVRGLAGRARL